MHPKLCVVMWFAQWLLLAGSRYRQCQKPKFRYTLGSGRSLYVNFNFLNYRFRPKPDPQICCRSPKFVADRLVHLFTNHLTLLLNFYTERTRYVTNIANADVEQFELRDQFDGPVFFVSLRGNFQN